MVFQKLQAAVVTPFPGLDLPSQQPEPSWMPSAAPSVQPSAAPSVQPSVVPSVQPSAMPSVQPSVAPSIQPSAVPSVIPSADPSPAATLDPAVLPSTDPNAVWGGCVPVWLWIVLAIVVAAVLAAVVILLVRRRRRRECPQIPYADPIQLGTEPIPGSDLSDYAQLSVGKVHEQGARESQQDCFAVSPAEMLEEHGLFAVVADGMGGLSDGDKVSQAAVGAMLDGFMSAQTEPGLMLPGLLGRANRAVNELLGAERLSRSGSTLVAVYVRDTAAYYISVGDSRICLLRDGVLYQLNREHIYRNELFTAAINGTGSLEQAVNHPKAGGLTSYLGMGQLKYVDLPAQPVWLRPGDKLILMSDGVYNALPADELVQLLEQDVSQAAQAVADRIKEKNFKYQDNYTAVIIGWGKGGDQT